MNTLALLPADGQRTALRLGLACSLEYAHELAAWYWCALGVDVRVCSRAASDDREPVNGIILERATYTDVLTGQMIAQRRALAAIADEVAR